LFDIAIQFSHKLYWYSTTLKMPKTQNMIFPHLDPFSEPWSHMWMKARKCFIFYSKNFSKYFEFKENNWSLFNSYVKQYNSTINEAILETYSIKREMYHARNFLFVCQLPTISKRSNTFVYIGARSYSHVIIDEWMYISCVLYTCTIKLYINFNEFAC
jgi:hypothetical protein